TLCSSSVQALFPQSVAEHSAEPEGMVCPVSLGVGRRGGLPELAYRAAEPEHDFGRFPLGRELRLQLLLQAKLERSRVGPFVLGPSRIRQHGRDRAQLARNGLRRTCILIRGHLPPP